MRRFSSWAVLQVLLCGALSLAPTKLVAQDRRATAPESIRARPGFRVDLLCSAQAGESSWISMTFDPAGRVVVGLDDQGLGRLTIDEPTGHTAFARIPGTESLRHVRGVLYAHDSLYVSATDSQGLYRLRDLGDTYAAPQLLQELSYNSRYGHGTNQITLGPDNLVYFVIGNDVVLPPAMAEDSPYSNPQNDWLLPSRHDLGHDNRVGYIVRYNPDGETWEVVAGGFRNQVDVAFNQDGEMFTWDADMEWDVGLPWYRPTRLNHVVSGGEYGWRWGTGKWPAWYPDSLPATLDTGLGSPTGLVFGYRSRWPERYRNALFMADWQFGRILMVDLLPRGTTYEASAQWFLEGGPLNVCDLNFGPDGALYFITGGRGSQSGLYRVTWNESDIDLHPGISLPEDPAAIHPSDLLAGEAARQLRRRLEIYHRRVDRTAIDFIWSQLGHDDPWIRFAARIALENQPLSAWRPRIETAGGSLELQTALLALARVGTPADQAVLIDRMLASTRFDADREQWLLPLRTLQVSLIRQGLPATSKQQQLAAQLEDLYPQDHFAVNWLLQELLVKLHSPVALSKSLELLDVATSQEEQIQYAKTMTQIESGWDRASAERIVAWLGRTQNLPGGQLVPATWRNLRADFTALWDAAILDSLVDALAALDRPQTAEAVELVPRAVVRKWTIEDLLDDVQLLKPEDRSLEAGQRALSAAMCLQCHRVGQRGTPLGPELTHVGRRFDGRALLESIIEPSRQVDPKYALSSFLLQDGTVVTGRTVGVSQTQLTIETDPLSRRTMVIERSEIDMSVEANRSPMPDGLLDTLTREEILDLLALLRRAD